MRRRDVLCSAAAGTAAYLGGRLSRPTIARAQTATTLRFVPQADVGILDPTFTAGLVNRNHGFLVYDTLYGVDLDGKIQPQMLMGHTVEDEGRLWTMTLREGLRFHDNEPVRARDVVASLRRWGVRDFFGNSLFSQVDELAAVDDRTIRWRLKRAFPKLPEALGKVGAIIAFIMPERLAASDPAIPVREIIGSGPFRLRADQLVPGSTIVYEKFPGYVPRSDGKPSLLAGPKVVHFDRVEWRIIPDAATAAAALQRGEVDWWEQPIFDLLPTLGSNKDIAQEVLDPYGNVGFLRFNHTLPPFNNPAVRRAVLGAVKQRDYMTAVAGDDTSRWRDKVGFFTPGGVMANQVGMEALDGSRTVEQSRAALQEAGYKGEKVTMMSPSDFPTISALSEVAADMFRKIGMNVDHLVMDWGSVLKRISNREVPERGGYNMFCAYSAGVTHLNPSAHNNLRGSGDKAVAGWPTSPKLEALRDTWFDTADDKTQAQIGVEMQKQAFIDVPYVPLGVFYQPTAYRKDVTGILKGLPLFWNVRRT